MEGLCAIYATRVRPCDAEDVAAAAPAGAAVEALPGEGPASARFMVPVAGGRLVLSVIDADAPSLRRQVEALTGMAIHAAGEKVDGRSYTVIRQVAGSWQVVGVAWDGPPDAADAADAATSGVVRALAERLCGLVVREGQLLDPAGRALLGEGPRALDPAATVPLAPDAAARKRAAEERLAAAGVPVNPDLPALPGEAQVLLRPAAEVARRAQALWAVTARADGIERYDAIDLLHKRGLWDAATPAEQEFLRSDDPPRDLRLAWRRRAEALRVLLWALDRVPTLGDLDAAGPLEAMTRTLRQVPAETFVADAHLRPVAAILDEADRVYRAHWAVADAALRSEDPPPSLHPAVVSQRHTALLWLIQHMKQPWAALAGAPSA